MELKRNYPFKLDMCGEAYEINETKVQVAVLISQSFWKVSGVTFVYFVSAFYVGSSYLASPFHTFIYLFYEQFGILCVRAEKRRPSPEFIHTDSEAKFWQMGRHCET